MLAATVIGAIGACDYQCQIIPDALVAALIVLGLTVHPLALDATTWQLALASTVALVVYLLFATYTRFRHGAEAFGSGGVKFMIAIAANIGLMLQFVIVIVACLSALLVHLLRRNHRNTAVPFERLVLGCIITLFLMGRYCFPQLTAF